ncbi:MAG TPA: peptidase M16 [Flavobacteriales bacterium]|nr:peptidase M16 [Flavobacteriales bacterium]|tara:strand:+ start:64846 stop:66087 length:1242 start_codon:yes stop_codon:yes gene_type:complete
MITFEKFTLENGLTVLFHQDKSTPLVAVNTLYKVGARDENPNKTGFAHLFEHLMFGGSKHIPDFDTPLQAVGGENNAFTNNDITNYYITLPKQNIETALWLESDRMLELAFTPESLEVQRKVVIEEFKQNYLNQPYGDIWHILRQMAYKVHPYQWPTIGKDISHIENATMEDVKAFFYKFYRPNNAILCIAGNLTLPQVKELVNKWYADIPKGEPVPQVYPQEPEQTEPRRNTVERDVPLNAFYRVYHMEGKNDKGYQATDLLSDILSHGESSRLKQRLVYEKRLFNELSAYVTGSFDPGLFVISGKLNNGVTFEQAEQAIDNELNDLRENLVSNDELQKVKNKIISLQKFGEIHILNKAMALAINESLGDANKINTEIELYKNVTAEDIRKQAIKIFKPENSSTLIYKAKNQ